MEVLVSLAVFALVALAIGQFTQLQLQTWSVIEQRAIAEIAAVSAMERAHVSNTQRSDYGVETKTTVAELPMIVVTHIDPTDIARYMNITIEVFLAQARDRRGPLLYQLHGGRYVANPP